MTDLAPETPGHTYGCACETCAKSRQARSYERHPCLIAEWHERPSDPPMAACRGDHSHVGPDRSPVRPPVIRNLVHQQMQAGGHPIH